MTNLDCYECLGAGVDSSQEEVKRAFRRMVRIYHPDLHPDDPDSEERLRHVVAAYHVLGNPVSRAQYDRIERLFGPRKRSREEVLDQKVFVWSQACCARAFSPDSVRRRKAQAGIPAAVCFLLACLVAVLFALAGTVGPSRPAVFSQAEIASPKAVGLPLSSTRAPGMTNGWSSRQYAGAQRPSVEPARYSAGLR